MDVLGIGYSAIDYIFLVPRYPAINEKLEYIEFEIQGGGPVATALVTLSRLGKSTSYIGCIGDDWNGDFIKREFIRENVKIQNLVVQKNKRSPLSIIIVDKNSGKRTILWSRKELDPYDEKLIKENLFDGVKVLHLDGFEIETALKAIFFARKRNIPVVVDAGGVKKGMDMLLENSDYFVASSVFARDFTGEKDKTRALMKLYKINKRCVVITYGEKGSIGIKNNKMVEVPAFKVDVKDTTGAGDVYHGGFIYGVLQNWGLKKTMIFASAISALKCMQLGGRKGIPDITRVNSFLKEHRNHIR